MAEFDGDVSVSQVTEDDLISEKNFTPRPSMKGDQCHNSEGCLFFNRGCLFSEGCLFFNRGCLF